VPAAEDVVGAWRAEYDLWAARGIPAHVTIQTPFLARGDIDARVLERLGAVLESAHAEPFELRSARYLPGIVYLAPASDAPFARLTRLIADVWPELPRYGGGIRSIGRYHLTVARTFRPRTARAAVRAVRPSLPISGRTDEALLFSLGGDARIELLARFGIGTHLDP
jgi:hypothetical protein